MKSNIKDAVKSVYENVAREDLEAKAPIVFTRIGIRRFDPSRDTEAHGWTRRPHKMGDKILIYLADSYDRPLYVKDFILDE